MFPLGGVLFPGQLLPLHIFEARYQQMLQHCLSTTSEFGVVLIERGHEVGGGDIRSHVGTVASIVDAVEAQPGHWAILAAGTRRIRVERWRRDDPWPNADVTDFGDDDADGSKVPALWAALQHKSLALSALAAELGDDSPPPPVSDDPGLGCYQIAALSPLGSFDRQKVLATGGLVPRLALLATLLDEVAETLRAAIALGNDEAPHA
jgi:uncharacterized protein